MRPNGAYLDVAGVHTYYEVSGVGDPVVLLHGGMATAETFDAQVAELSRHYRVYVAERRGHGRTPDVPGPLTYDIMADDNAAFLCALDLAPAHLVGWSDGAAVGLLTAWRYPELVRKLVYIGQNVTRDGLRPKYQAMSELSVEQLPPMLAEMYAAVSPDGPEHFKVVFDRLRSSLTSDLPLPMERLGEVLTPTLVMMGDDDIPSVEHAAAIHNRLADAQLAIVPGTSHALPMEKPDLVNRLILDFLADAQTPKLF